MKFGHCPSVPSHVPSRFELAEPHLGTISVDVRPPCRGGMDERRRTDLPVPKWGYTEVATMWASDGSGPVTNPDRVVPTEAGPIALGRTAREVHFTPNSRTLKGLFSLDSRRTAISDRYYK